MTWPTSLSPDPENPGPPHSLADLQALASDWVSPKREALQWLSDSIIRTHDGFNTLNGHSTSTIDTSTNADGSQTKDVIKQIVSKDNPNSHELVIPSDRIAIWEPIPWDNHGGRVTLAGDAAHSMTFHRGQGLNNCIRDAKELVDAIVCSVTSLENVNPSPISETIATYEKSMISRGAAEVRLSKEQTEKEHDWEEFQTSPIMKIGGHPVKQVDSLAWKEILNETTGGEEYLEKRLAVEV